MFTTEVGAEDTSWTEVNMRFMTQYEAINPSVAAKEALMKVKLEEGQQSSDFYHKVMCLCQEVHGDITDVNLAGPGTAQALQRYVDCGGIAISNLQECLWKTEAYL